MPTLPSKRTLDEQKPKFPLLPADDYTLKVESLEPHTQMNFDQTEEIEVVKAVFSIVSLKDGSVATDETGQKLHEKRRIMRDFDENRMGFTGDGIPSLTRQFVSYMLGVDPFAEDNDYNFEWSQFVGKTIGARVVKYIIKKGKNTGQFGNKIDAFLPERKSLADKLNAAPASIQDDDPGPSDEDAAGSLPGA